jgi:glycosyltransferase involved in cell wall biosynthesis
MNPFVSVIVCTRHREERLSQCLASLCAQTAARRQFEIIVVDNGDRALLRALPPGVRSIREEKVGLGAARNRGWRAARGAWVAFVDDDARAAPDWVEQIGRACDRLPSHAGCLGGRVEAVWEVPRPAWLSDELLVNLSVLDLGTPARELRRGESVIGCNLIVRREGLVQVNGFDEAFGRRGKKLLGMEEMLLQRQLARDGWTTHYDPAVVVYHHIGSERLTPRWFLAHAFWNGVSVARAERAEHAVNFRERARRARRALRTRLWRRATGYALGARSPDAARLAARCASVGWLGYTLAMLY